MMMPYSAKKTWSTLVLVMAWCLTEPSHYLINVDLSSMKSCGTEFKAISQWKIPIIEWGWKITESKSHLHLSKAIASLKNPWVNNINIVNFGQMCYAPTSSCLKIHKNNSIKIVLLLTLSKSIRRHWLMLNHMHYTILLKQFNKSYQQAKNKSSFDSTNIISLFCIHFCHQLIITMNFML